jgi:hypothetical protein
MKADNTARYIPSGDDRRNLSDSFPSMTRLAILSATPVRSKEALTKKARLAMTAVKVNRAKASIFQFSISGLEPYPIMRARIALQGLQGRSCKKDLDKGTFYLYISY